MLGKEILKEMDQPPMEIPVFRKVVKESMTKEEEAALSKAIAEERVKIQKKAQLRKDLDFSKDKFLATATAVTEAHYRKKREVLDENGKAIQKEEFRSKLLSEKAFRDVVDKYDASKLREMNRNHTIRTVVFEAYWENKKRMEKKEPEKKSPETEKNVGKEKNTGTDHMKKDSSNKEKPKGIASGGS